MASDWESAAAPPTAAQRSGWHSPVPYLFGGLAAMLGLIAFALVILACSYLKFAGENIEVESREEDGGAKAAAAVAEEKYVVIMAGQYKPTFLATPMSTIASSKSCVNNPPLEQLHHQQKRLQNVQIQMGII